MKKKLGLLIIGFTILLTLVVMAIVFKLQQNGDNFHHSDNETVTPAPKEHAQRGESEDSEKDREAFFKLMHNAAPGTNWQKMDADVRYQKMKERAARAQMKLEDTELDTIGGGAVVGQWNELGSFNTSGRIWATEVDYATDNIYAFTDGGNLWKGDLNGTNWSILNDNFKLTGVHMMRKIGSRLLVASSQWGVQGIYYTDDEGISWNATTGLENVATWGYVFDAEILNDAEHTIYALAYEWDYTNWWDIVSIYRSTDMGASFEKITSYDVPTYGGTNRYCLWASRSGDSTCYFIENHNFCSLDAAGMPQVIGTLPFTEDGDVMLCGYEGAMGTHLYVAQYNYTSTETDFYYSDDAGAYWNYSGSVDDGIFSKNNFNCSQIFEGQLYYGCLDTYRSDDKGANWVRNNYWYEYYDNNLNNLHADIPNIRTFVDPGSGEEMVLTSTDGGLFKSVNNGLTWTNITMENMRNSQYYDVYTYRWVDNMIFAGAQDQGYQRTNYVTGTHHYCDQLISGDYGHIVTRSGGDNLWCIYPGFAMFIYDAAASANMYFWDFQGTGQLWMAPIMQDPDDDEVAWWGGGSDAGGAYLWRLERSGGDITGVKQAKNFSVAGGGAISAINYSPIDHNYWYLLTSGGKFYYSTNAGATWTMSSGFTGPGPQYFYGAAIEPSKTQLGVVYIGGSGYSNPAVFVSYDNGASFTDAVDGLPNTLVYDLAISDDDSLLFAATEVAPYVYVTAEHKWYDLSAGEAPLQTYWSVDYVDEFHTVRFGTYGRGAWEFKLNGPANTNIADQINNAQMQIFPNPANAYTEISIHQNMPDAQVEIFDINGKMIAQQFAALNKDVPFKLVTADLANGIYFIRVSDKTRKSTPMVQRIVVGR